MVKYKRKDIRAGNIVSKNKGKVVIALSGLLLLIATSCRDKKKECNLDLSDYDTLKGVVTADSNKVVSYFDNYQTDAPEDFKGLVAYYVDEGMTQEQALEEALRTVRDYPEYYSNEVKNYTNTYYGLMDAFKQSKKSRDAAYKNANDDYENCKAGR